MGDTLVRVEVKAFGDRQMSREILRISDRARDPLPLFESIHEDFLEYEKKLFDSEGASGGTPWAPLKASTVAAKAAAGLDPRILHATLTLRDSLTEKNAPDSVFQTTMDEALMASSVEYGIYHQSNKPRTRLPRRPPVMLSPEVKAEWIKKVQVWLIMGDLV